MSDRWRVGRSTGRTIWYGEDVLHGLVDTPAIASRICEAMNEIGPLRARVAALETAIKRAGATCIHHEDADVPMTEDACALCLAEAPPSPGTAQPAIGGSPEGEPKRP